MCAEIRLEMTLRYLDCGSFWDIKNNYKVSVTEFYRSSWRVVDAINMAFNVDLYITDLDHLQQLEYGFAGK